MTLGKNTRRGLLNSLTREQLLIIANKYGCDVSTTKTGMESGIMRCLNKKTIVDEVNKMHN